MIKNSCKLLVLILALISLAPASNAQEVSNPAEYFKNLRPVETGDIDPALLAIERKMEGFKDIVILKKSEPNPYRSVNGYKLTLLAMAQLLKVSVECGGATVAATVAAAGSLVPITSAYTTDWVGSRRESKDHYGFLDFEDSGEQLLYGFGIGMPVYETVMNACSAASAGIGCVYDYLSTGHLKSWRGENLIDYKNTWGMLTSMSGAYSKLVADPHSLCGQAYEKFQLMIRAHNKTFD